MTFSGGLGSESSDMLLTDGSEKSVRVDDALILGAGQKGRFCDIIYVTLGKEGEILQGGKGLV